MEENVVKFQEKLKNLVALAKKKKNILEIQEINDAFRDMELEPTQMDKVFEYLEANGIDVLQINEKRLSWQREWQMVMKKRKSVLQKPTCDW